MIDCHGSQCGFCTPGFVVAMTGLLEERDALDEARLRRGLTGNLCRCTGYTPILDAAPQACDDAEHERLERPLSRRRRCSPTSPSAPPTRSSSSAERGRPRHAARRLPRDSRRRPRVPRRAPRRPHRRRRHRHRRPHQQVRPTARRRFSTSTASPSSTSSASQTARSPPAPAPAGRRCSTLASPACPEFARILSVFGAPQIRHVGTIGGNIANASPIADSLPFLYVMDATLALASSAGRREVNINDFYNGYKQLDLRPGELIAEVRIPLPAADELLRLYKVSRRRDLDIATFTAAIRMRLERRHDRRRSHRLRRRRPDRPPRPQDRSSSSSANRFTEDTMRAAGDVAAGEITPITDVRGAADYRRQLTRNILLKFYHETQADLAHADYDEFNHRRHDEHDEMEEIS